MDWKYTFSLLLILTLISCKEKTLQEPVVKSNQIEIPESFLSFYKQFNEDSIFQLKHIVFPLAEKEEGEKWTEDNWVVHKPFNNLGGEYTIEFDNFKNIIVEVIQDQQHIFRSERRFSEIQGEWHLIYYKVKTVRLE